MRACWGALLATAVLPACGPAGADPHPLSRPGPPDVWPGVEGCGEGFRVVARTDLGAVVGDVVPRGDQLYVATGTGVAVLDVRNSGSPPAVIETPGEALALALTGGGLWVADGTGGLARIGLDGGPAPGRVDRWPTGGNVVDVVAASEWVYGADASGRVVALPSHAAPGEALRSHPLGGWPASLAPHGDGVLVATGSGGLEGVVATQGAMEDARTPCEPPAASSVAVSGRRVFVTSGSRVVSCGDGGVRTLEVGRRVQGLSPAEDGVVVLLEGGGVVGWDGLAGEGVPGRAGPEVPPGEVAADPPRDPATDTTWLAMGRSGLRAAWVDGLRVRGGALRLAGGTIGALEPGPGGAVVALADGPDSGRVMRLDRDGSGRWRVSASWDVPGQPMCALADGDDVLVGTMRGGVRVLGPGTPPGGPGDGLLGSAEVHSLLSLGEGKALALLATSAQVTLARGPSGTWKATEERDTGMPFAPSTAAIARGVLAVGNVVHNVAGLLPLGPGAPPLWTATAAPTGRVADFSQVARVRAFGDAAWLPEPGVGLERLPLDGGPSQVLWMLPGAWDVVPWGDRLAVARGTAGVALVEWDPAAGPRVETACDLPGDARHLWVDGPRLVVASSGTLFEVERTGTGGEGRP